MTRKMETGSSRAVKMYEEMGMDKTDPVGYRNLKDLQYQESLGMTAVSKTKASHKEAELVLLSLSMPGVARTVECPNCKLDFQTNYAYQRYCGTECLRQALLEKGIRWDAEKTPEERWQGESPSNIRPETLQSLRQWAKRILEVPQIGLDLDTLLAAKESISAKDPDQSPGELSEVDQLLASLSL